MQFALSQKLSVHAGVTFEENEPPTSTIWHLLKALREYSVCDAMEYENCSGSLLYA